MHGLLAGVCNLVYSTLWEYQPQACGIERSASNSPGFVSTAWVIHIWHLWFERLHEGRVMQVPYAYQTPVTGSGTATTSSATRRTDSAVKMQEARWRDREPRSTLPTHPVARSALRSCHKPAPLQTRAHLAPNCFCSQVCSTLLSTSGATLPALAFLKGHGYDRLT